MRLTEAELMTQLIRLFESPTALGRRSTLLKELDVGAELAGITGDSRSCAASGARDQVRPAIQCLHPHTAAGQRAVIQVAPIITACASIVWGPLFDSIELRRVSDLEPDIRLNCLNP
jgi:hypothetical protein